MRFISKERKLEGQDLMMAGNPEKRQIVAHDLNEKEAKKMFKDLPWAKCLVTPQFYWFRSDG